jgi:alpha-tubulin suppressor-like RCC1 family protein
MARYIEAMIVRRRFARTAVPAAAAGLVLAFALGACVQDAGEPPVEPVQSRGFSEGDAGKVAIDAGPERKAMPRDDEDAGPSGCKSDVECSDQLVCNGVERCVQGACVPGDAPVCPHEHACSEKEHGCDCSTPDHDNDGKDAIVCGGKDCDDDDREVFPGNSETCDPGGLKDEDCDWHTHGALDEDGDREDSDQCCNLAPDGSRNCGGDCDDSRKNVSSSATEDCDGIDNDCNGYVDELPGSTENGSAMGTFYRDDDGDSQGDPKQIKRACMQPQGYASEPGDCADHEPQWFTGATEICDGLDNDCDGIVDEDVDLPAIARTQVECRGPEGLAIATCEPGYLDCADGVSDGCETPATTLRDCHACGRTCQFSCGSDDCDEITALASGDDNSCAITREGVAACWGSNSQGQIGDDTTPIALVPRKVGVLGPVERIAVGGAHVCATTRADGTLYCWGDNQHGQLGVASAPESSPVPLLAFGFSTNMLTGVIAIAAGRNHTCAIVDGAALCWGQDDQGQLGNGSVGEDDFTTPQAVVRGNQAMVRDAAAIVAGAAHTCMLTRDRTVECWGRNAYGQLGRADGGAPANAASAAPVSGLSDVDAIAAGTFHTCALSGGAVYCWGQNGSGQLGGSSTTSSGDPRTFDSTPRAVPELSGITRIAAGSAATCAIDQSGKLYCWGTSHNGELGVLSDQPSQPVAIAVEPVATVSMGLFHVCVQLVAGPVECWGSDSAGQLGDEQSTNQPLPLPRKLHWLYGSTP